MKYLCLNAYLAVLSFSSMVYGQVDWSWLHPYPSGYDINGVCFINESVGWFVNSGGEIFYTADGGSNWSKQHENYGSLHSVVFIDPNVAICCGAQDNQGVILTTSNGGGQWSAYSVDKPLYGLDYYNENYATTVGYQGTIIRTMNGGGTWNTQGSGVSVSLNDAFFVSPEEGWACGNNGILLHTDSYGAFWEQQIIPYANDFTGVYFTDPLNGFLVGEGQILFTDDGGDSWIVAASGTGFQSIDFQGSLGAAAGTYQVFLSTDQGVTWTGETVPCAPLTSFAPGFLDCSPTPSGHVVVGGQTGFAGIRSPGGVWSPLTHSIARENLKAVTHSPDNSIHTCGLNGLVMASHNGGTTWSAQVFDEDIDFQDIAFPTPDIGYISGRRSTDSKLILLKTVNAGATWVELETTPDVDIFSSSLDFMDGSNGVLVLNTGKIYRTTNGGSSWIERTGFSVSPARVRFGDTDRGWISCNNGEIICFDFNSDSWSEQVVPFSKNLNGLFALNQDTVWAAGWNGSLLRTNNAGNTWNVISVTGYDYTDICFESDGLPGYLVANRFGYTENGGYTIQNSPSGSFENSLSGVSISGSDQVVGCKSFSWLICLNEGSSGTEGPQYSMLSPATDLAIGMNPFVASTSVSFSLPSRESIELNLYDVSGRIVQRLFEGPLQPGEHCFSIDGTGLAPGMYFARLITEGSIENASIVRIH